MENIPALEFVTNTRLLVGGTEKVSASLMREKRVLAVVPDTGLALTGEDVLAIAFKARTATTFRGRNGRSQSSTPELDIWAEVLGDQTGFAERVQQLVDELSTPESSTYFDELRFYGALAARVFTDLPKYFDQEQGAVSLWKHLRMGPQPAEEIRAKLNGLHSGLSVSPSGGLT